MDGGLIVLCVGVFATILIAAMGLLRVVGDTEARRLRRRLREIAERDPVVQDALPAILRDNRYSANPAMDAFLHRLPFVVALHRMIVRADVKVSLGTFVALMVACAAFPVAVGLIVLHLSPPVAALGAVAAGIPLMWLRYKKVQRVRVFERQFPDALDILTSALRSGMAFSGAVQVVSEECADAVAKEFNLMFEENRLGIDMRVALRNLADRVDSKELHLFVIAVLLQRETGGNLVEVLEGAAAVIRERLRILGDVRALTAQARLSGVILSVLPVAVGMFILFTAPDYMRVLTHESSGRHLLFSAAVLQIVGYLIMRRIATIKV